MTIKRRIRRINDRWKMRRADQTWQYLFQKYRGEELVSLDIETTSLEVSKAQMLSIGAVVIKGNRVLTSEKLSITLSPPKELPQDSIKIHKLRRMDLNEGLSVQESLEKLLKFVGNRPVVGYSVAYDLAVLDRFLRPLFGFGMPNRYIDVMDLYRKKKALSGSGDCQMDLSFEGMAKCLDVPILGRHTALGDATTTAIIYVRLKSSASLVK
ncbi:MAG: 3'-5' exonuclease [Gammaproteobacteria bacterium]|nr:3'-5' exonuclease [Gammaproteobacteria bacterium]